MTALRRVFPKMQFVATTHSPVVLAEMAPHEIVRLIVDRDAAQRKKCAWCEVRQPFSSSPVEHTRPKVGAWRDLPEEPRTSRSRGTATSPAHYWWLTWTWENLLFGCARCNDQGHKANYFPLVPGTPERVEPSLVDGNLPADAFDTTTESPLLLDPTEADFDFLDHVRWEPSQTRLARPLWATT